MSGSSPLACPPPLGLPEGSEEHPEEAADGRGHRVEEEEHEVLQGGHQGPHVCDVIEVDDIEKGRHIVHKEHCRGFG